MLTLALLLRAPLSPLPQGKGIGKDMHEAMKWYGKAAQQGSLLAELMIAWYYHTGDGVEKNIEEAVKRYQKLADTPGEIRVCAASMNNLGVCYEKGEGVNESMEEAIKLYELAAKRGDTDAHFNLGRCYLMGKGVARNVEKAKLHFLRASGNAKSAEVLEALR